MKIFQKIEIKIEYIRICKLEIRYTQYIKGYENFRVEYYIILRIVLSHQSNKKTILFSIFIIFHDPIIIKKIKIMKNIYV